MSAKNSWWFILVLSIWKYLGLPMDLRRNPCRGTKHGYCVFHLHSSRQHIQKQPLLSTVHKAIHKLFPWCPTCAIRLVLLEVFWRSLWFPFLLEAASEMSKLPTVPTSKRSILGERLAEHLLQRFLLRWFFRLAFAISNSYLILTTLMLLMPDRNIQYVKFRNFLSQYTWHKFIMWDFYTMPSRNLCFDLTNFNSLNL